MKDMEKMLRARTAARNLQQFIGPDQLQIMMMFLRGEEGEWFADKLLGLERTVAAMPKSYETNGQGGAAVAHLRYFCGGRAVCYITEKDSDQDGEGQIQAYGLADLFGDGGECGYICLREWLENGAQLDLHYTPKTLDQVRARAQAVAV